MAAHTESAVSAVRVAAATRTRNAPVLQCRAQQRLGTGAPRGGRPPPWCPRRRTARVSRVSRVSRGQQARGVWSLHRVCVLTTTCLARKVGVRAQRDGAEGDVHAEAAQQVRQVHRPNAGCGAEPPHGTQVAQRRSQSPERHQHARQPAVPEHAWVSWRRIRTAKRARRCASSVQAFANSAFWLRGDAPVVGLPHVRHLRGMRAPVGSVCCRRLVGSRLGRRGVANHLATLEPCAAVARRLSGAAGARCARRPHAPGCTGHHGRASLVGRRVRCGSCVSSRTRHRATRGLPQRRNQPPMELVEARVADRGEV